MPLIAFEGGDGVGKATQSKRLVEKLRDIGKSASLYSFPRYDTDVGRAIRRHLVEETKLVVLKRQDSEHDGMCITRVNTNQPCNCPLLTSQDDALVFQSLMLVDKCDASVDMEVDLARGAFVVCDRWTSSSLAYGTADGLNHQWLEHIHAGLPQPELTFYLRVSELVSFERRPALRDRYERDRAKQELVAKNYDELAMTKPGWVVINGSGSRDQVAHAIWSNFMGKFSRFINP